MIPSSPYEPMMARLTDVIDETPTIKTFVLEPAEPYVFRAGQFAQVTVPGVGEAPFTPSSDPACPERIEVTVIRTGRVTEALHTLKPGAFVGLRGPFGVGYPLDELENQHVLIVGGGCGLAPLRSLIYALFGQMDRIQSLSIKYGARGSAELLYARAYGEWNRRPKVELSCTIDLAEAGWTGNVGVVTTLVETIGTPLDQTVAVSCGPEVMLKFVAAALVKAGLPPERIVLSMNRRMSCGIGKCGRCNIGPYYLCRDGPDISYAKIKDFAHVF